MAGLKTTLRGGWQVCTPICSAFRLQNVLRRFASTASSGTFKFSDLQVELCKPDQRKPKPDSSKLLFGKHFSDHMLEILWSSDKGWGKPRICPVHDLVLHPGAKVFHYATELFEGMKAYRTVDDKIVLFRPDQNIKRMLGSAKKAYLPSFKENEFLQCLKKLVSIDKDWVPRLELSSLYIRPTMIGTEPSLGVAMSVTATLFVLIGPVGPYFATGMKPVSLLADPQFVRAWPGGSGDTKMGCNYAPTISIQRYAENKGHQQILWLFGNDHQVTEVGTMNIFIFFKYKTGECELVTPPLNGLILPGVTRTSLLDLTREWGEFKVTEKIITMDEIIKGLEDKTVLEIFGAGTACVVCPVHNIHYKDRDIHIPTMDQKDPLFERLLKALTDIQYGRVKHPWTIDID